MTDMSKGRTIIYEGYEMQDLYSAAQKLVKYGWKLGKPWQDEEDHMWYVELTKPGDGE